MNAADIDSLRGWPESLVLDFKEDLPFQSRRGPDGKDAWHTGGNVEKYAKERIFKAVVALANSSGGHVVLGVSETEDRPPTALAIKPLPRCAELAESLERAAQSIDPPIAFLGVQSVKTDGDVGVVLLRVPASPRAPHRSIDNECYVRRGTESVPVSMREIQEMVLSSLRRGDRVEEILKASSRDFQNWLSSLSKTDLHVAFRVTAAPMASQMDIGRLYGRGDLVSFPHDFDAMIDGQPRKLIAPDFPFQERPVIRGTQFSDDHSIVQLYSAGWGQLWFWIPTQTPLYLEWMLGHALKLLLSCHKLRSLAGLPEQEYAVELEVRAKLPDANVKVMRGGIHGSFAELGELRTPIVFPRLPLGSISGLDEVLSVLATDIRDGTGARHPKSMSVRLTSGQGLA